MLTALKLRETLAPVLESMAYAFVGTECFQSHGEPGLRLYVDREGGVDCNDCATISEQAAAVLAVSDPAYGQYTLEVSSPGLDRPLFTLEDFQAFVGKVIKIQLHRPVHKQRRWQGKLTQAGKDGSIHLSCTRTREATVCVTTFENIEKARLVPNFGELKHV